MRVYVDLDVAVKLARWGILKRFVVFMTKVRAAELYTVPTLHFRLRNQQKAMRLVGSQGALDALNAFSAACKRPTIHDVAVANALVGVSGIDVGEAALFAAVANSDAAICDTGDKVAMRALGAMVLTLPALKPLLGKIACTEQTLIHLIDRWTFTTVSAAVASDHTADPSSTQCFVHGAESLVRGALNTKIAGLIADANGLIGTTPFVWKP